jgi:hypothetical protein
LLRAFISKLPPTAVSDSATDFYHSKPSSELLYFVEHPDLYQPSVVEAARRELSRRGVALPAPTAPVVDYEPAPRRAWGKIVGLGLGLVVLGGGSYWLQQRSAAAEAVVRAREEARRRLPPPKLTEVPTNAIPNYDGVVARVVAEQLKTVPAAEKANQQHLRQFRLLSKLFWAAQTQTEYLTNQANAGKATEFFTEQTLVARQSWNAWNQAAVYTYNFGPVMKEKYSRMVEAASNQQHILNEMPGLLTSGKLSTDEEMRSRSKDVEDLVGGLTPVSPVSGKTYKRTVLKMK